MTQKKTNVVLIVLSVLLILAPILLMLAPTFLMYSQHDLTFYGALDAKVDRLDSIEGNKIVVLGGSSVAFGIDSEMIEQATPGFEVVNFGLYADLGTKLMLDLSEDAIRAGDIIILAPELDPQTLSLYFSGASTWKAFDNDPSLLLRLKKENLSSMWGSMFAHSINKLKYALTEKPELDNAYHSKNFNKYGDFEWKGENEAYAPTENKMAATGYYQSSTPINPDISTYASDFIDYINDYVKRMTARGATVYYNWCPMNRYAIVGELYDDKGNLRTDGNGNAVEGCIEDDELPLEKIAQFEADLAAALDCPILGSFTDYIYEPEYMYDSNFHLNEAGVIKHTVNLLTDFYRVYTAGNQVYTPTVEIPSAPPLPEITLADPDRIYTVGDFLLQAREEGEGYFAVVGLSEVGLTKKTVILPREHVTNDGITLPVKVIESDAFSNTTVTKNVIVPDMPMNAIKDNAFRGSSVENLYLYCPLERDGEVISPGTYATGAHPKFKTHVTMNYYYDYLIDYFWSSVDMEQLPTSYADLLQSLGITE